MKKLQKLIQGESGDLTRKDGTLIKHEMRVGQMRTIMVESSTSSIDSVVNKLAESGSALIPSNADAYVHSNYNFHMQVVRDKKMYSFYALQFYRVFE